MRLEYLLSLPIVGVVAQIPYRAPLAARQGPWLNSTTTTTKPQDPPPDVKTPPPGDKHTTEPPPPVITPDPTSVSADTTDTITGVTENTVVSTTDKDGHPTVVPVLFGAPCLLFCEHIGPGGGPGGIVLWGVGPGDGTYVLPPIPGLVPAPSAVEIHGGKPTPVEGEEDPDESEKSDDQTTEKKTTTEPTSTTTATTTTTGEPVASYGVTSIRIDVQPSPMTTTTTGPAETFSYGVTSIRIDVQPSPVTTTTTGPAETFSYGVTSIRIDVQPSPVTTTTTGPADTFSYGVTSIIIDQDPSPMTTTATGSTTTTGPTSTTGPPTTTTSPPTTTMTTTTSPAESYICVPYQNPHEGLSYCTCSQDGVYTSLPMLTTTGFLCAYTAFTVAPPTPTPTTQAPWTHTDPWGNVMVCTDYSSSMVNLPQIPYLTTCNVDEATISTGLPTPTPLPDKNCNIQASRYSDADCFIVCGKYHTHWVTEVGVPEEDNLLWSDEETDPTGMPWDLKGADMGISEDISFNWDMGDTCFCEIDGERIEGQLSGDGDDDLFQSWSRDTCECDFTCHIPE